MVYCTISWVHNIGRRWCEKELLSYTTGLQGTESSMKKLLLSVGIALLLVGLVSSGSAVVIHPSDQFLVGNETYTVNATMVFDHIIVSDTYIVFNDTGFYVSSPNNILITLVYISDHFSSAGDGENVLDFYATATSGTVVFDLSGFPVGREYLIKRNGVNHATSTASGGGVISFTNAAWSTLRFQVYQQGNGSGDNTPPQISGVTRVTSNPLDTHPSYGWVNVSCIVTDDVAVSQVVLRIHLPSGSWNNVTMTLRASGLSYYNSTSAFSAAGNYTYTIRAQDTSGNAMTTSIQDFSMPPNWEMNMDGILTVLDLVLVSNQYGQSGANGWIREDVDNNGQIEVLDLVLMSNHFGEEWW
jgi:hypothetical protein